MSDTHDHSEAEGIPADVQARFVSIEQRIERPIVADVSDNYWRFVVKRSVTDAHKSRVGLAGCSLHVARDMIDDVIVLLRN